MKNIMNKKEFLIKILAIIGKERALAQAIKILVEQWQLGDVFMDKLIAMMNDFIETTEDIKKKEVMKKWRDMIKKMQQKEIGEKEIDQKEIDQLEKLLNTVT